MGHKTRRLLAATALVLGAGVAGAQTTPTMTSTPTTTSSPSALAASSPAVEQIVAIARTVEPGTPGVTAFTVPTGQQLVVTDVVITNPSTTPVCGASVSGGSTVTAPATSTTAVESGTGTLCVGAQTSLSLSLTTGLEFAGGQSVQLANQPLATTGTAAATSTATTTASTTTTTAAATSGPLFYHLRGFLVATGA